VTVLGRTAPPVADVSGWGEFPLREVPLSATVVGREQLQQSGARRLADLTRFDASVTDAYNAPGYWDFLTVRGFTLDNRFNYRREGLPISAETSIPLDNKERIEILKGTSGIQAGTSAPGGLVNYAVKRPTAQTLRELRLEASSRASVLAALDISDHIGADQAVGFRLNLATESLKPLTRSLDGQRQLAALATDWRIGADSRLQAEVEWSHKKQPSQAAYSLLGNRLPDPVDPKRLNLNNQPWSQPSVFDALTGTLRFEQGLGTRLALERHLGPPKPEDGRPAGLRFWLQCRQQLRPLLQRRHL
jgi:iron complex outermembrane receptor protein